MKRRYTNIEGLAEPGVNLKYPDSFPDDFKIDTKVIPLSGTGSLQNDDYVTMTYNANPDEMIR